MPGTLPGLTLAPSFRHVLADEPGFEIGETDLVRPVVDEFAAQDKVVASIVQPEDNETTNTGRAHLAEGDLHGAAIR